MLVLERSFAQHPCCLPQDLRRTAAFASLCGQRSCCLLTNPEVIRAGNEPSLHIHPYKSANIGIHSLSSPFRIFTAKSSNPKRIEDVNYHFVPIVAGITDHCAQGVKHTGEAVGRVRRSRVSRPTSPTPLLAHGSQEGYPLLRGYFSPLYINAKLLQDYYASHDPVQNHSDDPSFDRGVWVRKAFGVAQDATPKWIDAVREKYGQTQSTLQSVIASGVLLLSTSQPPTSFATAAFAHPGGLTEDQFKQVKQPLFFLAPRHRAEEILAEIKATYTSSSSPGWAKEESARSIVGWFKSQIKRHFMNASSPEAHRQSFAAAARIAPQKRILRGSSWYHYSIITLNGRERDYATSFSLSSSGLIENISQSLQQIFADASFFKTYEISQSLEHYGSRTHQISAGM
ncbi:hypothetical protein BJ912DRAFT_926951 [Pholiota molesta]|nr:hypothetical protein BJ912DRAFT_926951 [Pholiota molesta]